MSRRDCIALVAGVTALHPLCARGQGKSLPVVALLRSTPAAPFGHIVTALRQGLAEEGLAEGSNVVIEQRWADNKIERLPELAAELVRRRVSVIVGNSVAIEAARAATRTIPIVFVTSDDPVKRGLVKSLGRPGGNVTGLTFFGGGQLGAKKLQLLSEVASGPTLAFLMDPTFTASKLELQDVERAATAIGRRVVVLKAAVVSELEGAFDTARSEGAGSILVSGCPFFSSNRGALIGLAARHRIAAIYDIREFVAEGGLMSYSASLTDAYRHAGRYAALIAKGARPAELPVLQPTKFELVINLKTATALGISVPARLVAIADEVIE
jgi:putative ABC transport system substrate-binding protein